jgi:HAMP domain-containing protein
MTPNDGSSGTITTRKMLIRAAAALWIAWKFLENEHIPLAKLASKVDEQEDLKGEIVDMEVDILQTIDF